MEENRLQRTSTNDSSKRKQQSRSTDMSFANELQDVLNALDISGQGSFSLPEVDFEENDRRKKRKRTQQEARQQDAERAQRDQFGWHNIKIDGI